MGITGEVFYGNTPYGGQPVTIPAAPVTDQGVNFFVGTYELDALLWAFYESGSLQVAVTPSMLPDPQYLNTTFYQTLLPQLYDFAPDADMTVAVAATQPPAITNGPVYSISPRVLAALKAQLPDSTYTMLADSEMAKHGGVVCATLDDFNRRLKHTLTAGDYQTYSSQFKSISSSSRNRSGRA